MKLKPFVAGLLAASLIGGLPGPAFYEAAAQTVPAAVEAPILAVGPAGAAAAPAAGAPSFAPLPALGTSLAPLVSLPALAPADVRAAAQGAAAAADRPSTIRRAESSLQPSLGRGPAGLRPSAARSGPAPAFKKRAPARTLEAARAAVVVVPATQTDERARAEAGRSFDLSGLRANEPEEPGPREDGLGLPPASPGRTGDEAGPKTVQAAPPGAPAPGASPVAPADGKVKLPRSLWGLVLGHQILIIIGINLHIFSQAFLVYGLTGSKAMIGVVRNIHFGSYTGSSFLPIGPTIDKTDFKTIFNGTSMVRALLMGAIPFLFMTHHLTFAALAAIVAVNPIFQNLMTTADTTATDSFLGTDEKLNKEAAATLTKVDSAANIFIPLLAGWIVSSLVEWFGDPGGYAMAYAGYAALLLVALPFFTFMVKDPRHDDPSITEKPSRSYLNIFEPVAVAIRGLLFVAGLTEAVRAALRTCRAYRATHGAASSFAFAAAAALLSPAWLPLVVLAVWVGRAVRLARSARAALERARSAASEAAGDARIPRREKLALFFDRFKATRGFAVILRSKVLSTLVAVGAVEMFLSDALMFVVLPNYIIDVVNPRLDLSKLPFLGSLLSTRAGIYTLMVMAASVGSYLASHWIEGAKGDERLKKHGHARLYRAAALGSLAFVLMLLPTFWLPSPDVQHMIHQGYGAMASAAPHSPAAEAGKALVLKGLAQIPLWTFYASLAIVMAVQFIERVMHTPLSVAMRPVKRKEIPNDKLGVVNGAFTMIDVGLMAVGALSIGFLVDLMSVRASLLIITAGIAVTAVLEGLAPKWLSKENPKGWYPGGGKPSIGSEASEAPAAPPPAPPAEPGAPKDGDSAWLVPAGAPALA